ncbi:tricalbin [Cutaneotrichosporon oleaginosum]|uniref:Tricalbin n=1 Tax=Cutaneotrichosporon oleaginosum TaxID=879819 RepID=A0A0J1B974_9TREE|nr:tricalbin [Cutaneotrichosporon oleaginosum]KLT44354.1 tricalbin [Cutaneotrichosporon oleaginosum]TXT07920.1 hypothetical protein COLE_04844 [Cutaneotrichosporon oleaginosum]
MAQDPYPGAAQAANINPKDVAPSSLNKRQQEAVANVVAHDAAKGATVYSFDPKASPEEKTEVAGSKRGGLKGVFGAPKALGRGVVSVGQGVGKGVGAVGKGAVQGVGAVGGAAIHGVGAVGKGATGVVTGVGGAAIGGVGALGGQAKNVLGSMPGMGALKDDPKNSARAVAIDTSTAGSAPKPTVSLADAKKASAPTEDDIPGTIPKTVLPGIPEWMGIGWKEVAGIAGQGRPDAQTAQELSILSGFLKEQYYGSWYHNAGVIFFAVLATRFVTWLRFGWGSLFIILATCATYYSLSIKRTRQRARDDIQRELSKTRLMTENESAGWLNSFLERFWLIYEPVLSKTIVDGVAPALEANCPSFLDSLKLTTFTLGNKAPRIDYVRTFPRTPDDIVVMDWALSFTPTDDSDIPPNQAEHRTKPRIVLEIRVGKGMVSTGMPVLLENICFSGRMRIKMTLINNFPHIQKVEISFLEQPTFDYVLKPIGGDTLGFDINSIPGLAPFIRDQVHSNLGPMMYDPNVFTLDLEQMMAGSPLDAANGVLKVQIIDAKDLKGAKFGGGDPDPYVSLSVGASEAVARTRTIESSTSPTWNETQFVLIKSLNDMLSLNVMDYNEMRSDALLGTVNHELLTLAEDAEQEGIVGRILDAGKDRGEMRYNLSYYPAILPEKNPDGTFQPLPDVPSGIARLEILQAKDFGLGNDISAKALIYLGKGKVPIHETKVVKKNASPGWNDHVEFICADKNASVITARVIDTKSEREIGRVAVRLADILEGKAKGNDWFPLSGSKGAKIRLTAAFKPVNLPGSIDGASTYVPPIGVLRIHLKNAVDVKNVEAMGKSDPYAKVMVGSKTFARTEVCDDTLNPTWDQIVYVPVHSLKERVTIELMDYQNIGKDRSLGSVTLNVSETAIENPSNTAYPYQSTGRRSLSERIFLGKNNQYKGTLNFDVDFNPAMSLRGGVSFDAKANDVQEAAQAAVSANGSSPNGTTGEAGAMETLSDTPSDAKAAPKDKDGNPIKEEETAAADPEKGVVMTPEQLVQSQSGVLVFQVIEGTLARKGALEILFDDGYWPAYTSERARSAHQRWDQVGEGFVRELDFGRTWLRINANDDDEKEDIVAEVQMETREFLEQALNKEATFILSDPKGNGGRSSVKMSARYVPVDIQLTPRESMNDQGMLSVTLVGGKGLKGVDRGGKSDPNVTFLLNDVKVFKSETKKKTRDPQWNEQFETVVPSRVRSRFIAQVNDWDRVGSATPMGDAVIDLAAMEPFQPSNIDVPVMHNGESHGTLQLQMVFRPMIIARHRTNTNAFGSAGRAITSIGGAALGAPVAVGKGVVGGVGRGVGTVVGAPGRLFGRNKNRSASVTQNQPQEILREVDENPSVSGSHLAVPGYELGQGQSPQASAGQVSAPAGTSGGSLPVGQEATTLPPGAAEAPQEPGTLTVSVLSVKDVQPQGSHSASALKPYVAVRVGHKSQKTDHIKGTEGDFNETFGFNLAPGTTQLSLSVYDKHTLGKDTELGEAVVDIWRHLQPAIPTADVFVELTQGSGQVKLRLDWQAGTLQRGMSRIRSRTPSVSSRQGIVPETPRSSKFALTPTKSIANGQSAQ